MSPPEDDGGAVSDEELAALALAADPHAPLDPDAVPWYGASSTRRALLPEWYMPVPVATGRRRGTMIVLAVIVVGFVVIDACGLCITSGFLSWA